MFQIITSSSLNQLFQYDVQYIQHIGKGEVPNSTSWRSHSALKYVQNSLEFWYFREKFICSYMTPVMSKRHKQSCPTHRHSRSNSTRCHASVQPQNNDDLAKILKSYCTIDVHCMIMYARVFFFLIRNSPQASSMSLYRQDCLQGLLNDFNRTCTVNYERMLYIIRKKDRTYMTNETSKFINTPL